MTSIVFGGIGLFYGKNVFHFLILLTLWPIIVFIKPDWWFVPYLEKYDKNFLVTKFIR